MPQVDFGSAAGTTLGWAADLQLVFSTGFLAGDLFLDQSGPDVLVSCGGATVRLSTVTVAQLLESNFLFQNGGLVRLAPGVGTDILTGGAVGDYLGLSGGGADSADGGNGDDVFDMRATLDASDTIIGGSGFDTVRLTGAMAVTLGATTMTGVEKIVWRGGGTLTLVLDNATVASVLGFLTVDGTAAGQADRLGVNASAVLTNAVRLWGGAGLDTLTGGGGADELAGGEGADLLSGGGGDDVLTGGQGADTLTGGAGTDLFRLFPGALQSDSSPTTIDLVTDFEGLGVAGGDLLDLPAGGFGVLPFVLNAAPGGLLPEFVGDGLADIAWSWVSLPGFSGIEVLIDVDDDGQVGEQDFLLRIATANSGAILSELDFSDALTVWRGTAAGDVYVGSLSANTAYGVGGDDTLSGNGGNDTLYGAAGSDALSGGGSNDLLYGGDDSDTLSGGEQNDTLLGEDAADVLSGDEGHDELFGGAADDTLTGGTGDDGLTGDEGLDDLSGGAGDDALQGGAEADTLRGEADNDLLHGGEGTDRLFGGDHDDSLSGDLGADTLTGDGGADVFGFASSTESTLAAPDRVTDFSRGQGDRLSFGANGQMDGFDRWLVFMGQLGPGFTGLAGDPFVRAGDGLTGAELGTDFAQVWWQASGTDVMVYADTNGNYELDGTDLVVRLENLSTLADTDFVADSFRVKVGDALGNLITGTAFGDTIFGLGGADTLNGLDGWNIVYGGQGADRLTGGLDRDDLFGGTEADSLYGGEGDNQLFGGAGNDWLEGGTGSEMLFGDEGTDTLTAGAGADDLHGGAANDQLFAGSGDDALSGDDGADLLYGGDDADNLDGGTGNDSLDGGTGDDTLYFGLGRDTLVGGTGADLFWLQSSPGSILSATDRVTDFNRVEGDLLALGDGGSFDQIWRSLVWMGQLSAGFTGGLGQSFERLGTPAPTLDFASATIWWRASGADVFVYVDVDDDLTFDSADAVFRLDGAVALFYSDFRAGTFLVQVGSDLADTMTGTPGNDTIYALSGNDTVTGLAGSDSLIGGAGADSLSGGEDSDSLTGGTENDTLLGDEGGDNVVGEEGNDSLYGGADGDALWGGDGVDRLFGGTEGDGLYGGGSNDLLYGDDGDDQLYGDDQNDRLEGGAGEDGLSGGSGADTLLGGAGIDWLAGNIGADRLTGGTEADVFVLSASSDSTLVESDRITDFRRSTGDRLEFGNAGQMDGYERWLVFMGRLDAGFTPVQGSAFVSAEGRNPADLGAGFAQVWWRADTGFLQVFVDVNDNLVLDDTDLVLRLDGVSSLSAADFISGTFRVRAGTSADESLTGTIGTDRIYGLAGNDTLNALDGDDWLHGSAGLDSLRGGLGVDRLFGGDGADTILGENGTDQLYGGQDGDRLDGGNDADALWGESGNDTLIGGFGADEIYGGEDADSLTGGGDDDGLYGDQGNDTLTGNGGLDRLSGGDGADSLLGNEGDDTLAGDLGADRLTGGAGADLFYWSGAGDSTRTQRDTVLDFAAGDQLGLGGSGQFNAAGRYLHYMGQLGPAFSALPGAAYAPVAGASAADIGPGFAQVWWRVSGTTTTLYVDVDDSFTLSVADLVVTLSGVTGLSVGAFQPGTFTALVGDHLDNLLTGGPGADTIFGVGGADTLIGAEAEDWLYGGLGDDSLQGDDGFDRLFGGDGNDRIEDANGPDQAFGEAGNDTLSLGADGDLAYGGDGDDLIDGGTESDQLYGDGGNDTLVGGQGVDYLTGGEGDDLFLLARASHFAAGEMMSGDDGWDVIRLTGAIAGDTLVLTSSVTGIEEVAIADAAGDTSGTTAMSINAAALGSGVVLRGNAGANRLTGSAFDDRLVGGLGADTLAGGAGIDELSHETDSAGVSVNLSLGTSSGGTAAGDVISGFENLRGGTGNDSLVGNSGVNRLNGTSGTDTLEGQGGNDTYVLRAGTLIVEALNAGFDTVETDATATLGANLEGLRLTGSAAINGTGNGAANRIEGNGAANILFGDLGADTLLGGGGADRLDGGGGSDTLTGGDGADIFVFTAPALGPDTLTDFVVGEDRIEITGAAFGGLPPGALDGTRFAANLSGQATTGNHRLIYEQDTGFLFYDADGLGGTARIRIATLASLPDLSAADFLVV